MTSTGPAKISLAIYTTLKQKSLLALLHSDFYSILKIIMAN